MGGGCSIFWRTPPTRPSRGGVISTDLLQDLLGDSRRRFDKGGEAFTTRYRRCTNRCAARIRCCAVLVCAHADGGCDPLYIARRVVRMASEEIGNADPARCRCA